MADSILSGGELGISCAVPGLGEASAKMLSLSHCPFLFLRFPEFIPDAAKQKMPSACSG
jgi:hypothetical protein